MAWEYPLLLLQIVSHAIKRGPDYQIEKEPVFFSHRWVPSLNLLTVYVPVCKAAASEGQAGLTRQHPMKPFM